MRPHATAPILVTGAAGEVGREVAAALLARGVAIRVAGPSPGVLHWLHTAFPGAEPVRLDEREPSSFGAAARGCRALFLSRPPGLPRAALTLAALVDAARVEGVAEVVFLSEAGAAGNRLAPDGAVERHLAEGPPGWTVLRPGFLAQNLGGACRRDIREDDRLYLPAGSGRVAFLDARDVGEVAALALTAPAAHAHRAYTLTGPAATSFAEAAGLLTAALGRRIRYVPASVPGYLLHLRRRGLPWGQALGQAVATAGLRFGKGATVDPTLPRLLGRPARTLADYLRAHAALWRR
jgi:uncharacterized protein YbjT (DUF2867 family)